MAKLTAAGLFDLAVHTALRAAPTDFVSAFGSWAVSVRGPKAYPIADRLVSEGRAAVEGAQHLKAAEAGGKGHRPPRPVPGQLGGLRPRPVVNRHRPRRLP